MLPSDLLILILASISVVDSNNCFSNGNAIPVCSDDSITNKFVYLSGVIAGDDTTQCSCSLSTGSQTNVTITEHKIPHGCQYEFQFLYMTENWIYSCNQRSVMSIRTNVGIEINLLSGTADTGGFGACVQITPDSPLTLACGKSRWSTTSYKPTDIQTSFTESITTSGDESSEPASGNESNQTTSDRESNQLTSDRESNQPTTITFGSESEQQTIPASKNDNSMSAKIGGAVGGLIVIIVIIIIIVICLIRKRRKDKNYESPEAVVTDAHPYQNIADTRSGEITHQPKQNNESVNQENDPYTSIDNDIIKPSNGNQGMEYLENDLYISSDDVINNVVVDDKLKAKLPVVAEYAQVNKSNANKTTNGKYKLGPKGDKYTVVNKGEKMINNDKQFKIGPSGDKYAIVKKAKKKNNNESEEEFKIGPSGDQYAVVNKETKF